MKTCTRCGVSYPPECFRQDPSKKDGRYPRCRGCTSSAGWAGLVKVVRRRPCPGCGGYFSPRRPTSDAPLVRHCSRACAAEAGAFSREGNARWTGDSASYNAVHTRLRHRHDPGSCERCGAEGVTLHWALDHERCQSPLASAEGPYSTSLDDYLRLCVPCHKEMDLGRFLEVPPRVPPVPVTVRKKLHAQLLRQGCP